MYDRKKFCSSQNVMDVSFFVVKSGPKLETGCFYCKGTGHWKRNFPKYLADKKDGKVNKGIFDIHVIDVYLTQCWGYRLSGTYRSTNDKG